MATGPATKAKKQDLKAIEKGRAEVLEKERAEIARMMQRMAVYAGNTAVIRAYIAGTV